MKWVRKEVKIFSTLTLFFSLSEISSYFYERFLRLAFLRRSFQPPPPPPPPNFWTVFQNDINSEQVRVREKERKRGRKREEFEMITNIMFWISVHFTFIQNFLHKIVCSLCFSLLRAYLSSLVKFTQVMNYAVKKWEKRDFSIVFSPNLRLFFKTNHGIFVSLLVVYLCECVR